MNQKNMIVVVLIALALVTSATLIATHDAEARGVKIKKERVYTQSGSNGGPNGENGGNGESICGGTCRSNSNDITINH
jgi:hypothetical protein